MPTTGRQMPRRIYPLRILGMGLGGMVVATVLWERQASPLAWTVLLLATLVWPHVAYLLTRRAADPYAAEVRNLLIDSALVAALVPLMHFNLLPSVMLLTLTMVDKITTGIRGLWVRALWVMLAAGVASTAVMGLHWAPETSMRVMVACLPVMSLHTLSVSAVSYQLIRQSARQNQMLDELRRVDALTGLFGRGHWQEQAEAALRSHHTTDEPACMLMLDIDHFKEINDRHSHAVGDRVLQSLAALLRAHVRQGDLPARMAGDEFVIVFFDADLGTARMACERLRGAVREFAWRELAPGVDVDISIGLAEATPQDTMHTLLARADEDMYRMKSVRRADESPVR